MKELYYSLKSAWNFNDSRLDVLSSYFFLFFLSGLVFNDHLFKILYPNILTGKLSDFFGLFIFPFFISALYPKRIKSIYIFTLIIFIVWKSSFIQPIINEFNSIGLKFNRVVDYSDYIALTILPCSFYYLKNKLSKVVKKATLFNKLVLLSCFFFSVATTLPHEEIILNKTNSIEYNVNISKTELLSKLTPLNNYSGAQEYNIRDTLFIIYISNNKERVESIVNIQEISKNITKIRFDKFNSVTIEGGFSGVEEELKTKWKTKSTEDYNYYIQNHFIDKIIAGDFQYIYFDNLRIHNEWKNKEKDRQRATIIIN